MNFFYLSATIRFPQLVPMKAFVCVLSLLSLVLLCCCHSYVPSEFHEQPQIAAATRHLLDVKSSCLGCVSYPRNVPNFRTRSRHQAPPVHQDATAYLTGRKMLQSKEALVDSNKELQSPLPLVVHQIDHPDRYVPGGPDPLHHRSTPPSMIPDLN